MLDYKLIEAMAMVVKERGFDRAARALHLTQSAVSQRVKLLEEQTGQVLLARTSPPSATRAGRQMLKLYHQVTRLEGDLFETLTPSRGDRFESISVGINEDSLATWFFNAVHPFLERENVTLELREDDQEQTHRFLKDGEVMGCISSLGVPVQGCSMTKLGSMNYRLLASPDFVSRWFPSGFDREGVLKAPAVNFNRKDNLHKMFLEQAFGAVPSPISTHYFPSSEKFADFIASGLAYGALPDLQSESFLQAGTLIDLMPANHIAVNLNWHCWNLKSALLERFTRIIIGQAREILR